MSRGDYLRGAFVVFIIIVFAGSLAGIVLTGPVIVRVPRVQVEGDPSRLRLRADVEHLCGEFAPRDARDPDSLRRAAGWIADRLRETGLAVELQEYEVAGRIYYNVVATRPGTETAAPLRVLGAHYDAYPGLPGADDNASGVAVMLELARSLPATAPRATQKFVAFSTGAPPGLDVREMGSDVFARALVADGIDVETMISLDTVGYYSDRRGTQRSPVRGIPFIYPRRGNFISVVGDLASGPAIGRVKRGLMGARSIPVRSLRAPSHWASVSRSDHTVFRAHDMPAVLVTDTSYLRNPHYHGITDTPQQLDYDRMAGLVAALHVLFVD